jgi:hypothetical protein
MIMIERAIHVQRIGTAIDELGPRARRTKAFAAETKVKNLEDRHRTAGR